MTSRILLLLALLMLPARAAAAVDCAALLQSQAAVSPYTARVLERMHTSLSFIASGSATGAPAGPERYAQAVQWATAVMAATVDTYVQVVEGAQSLTIRTACEEYDVLLLQCGMEQVRGRMNAAIGSGDFGSAYLLQELHAFLQQRLRVLLTGARDPRVQDAPWGERRPFDPPTTVWCCLSEGEREGDEGGICRARTEAECADQGVPFSTLASCTAFGCSAPDPLPDATGMLCPFSSDYFPPSSDGFGCDLSVLDALQGYDGASRDANAMRGLVEALATFRASGRGLLNLEARIEALLQGSPVPAEPAPPDDPGPGQHRVFEGCPLAVCSDDDTRACLQNSDCSSGAYCRRGWKRCTGNGGEFCSDDADCARGGGGSCVLTDPPDDFAAWELRGSFSAVRDESKLLSVFRDLRGREPREFSQELKLPDERNPGDKDIPINYPGESNLRAATRATIGATVQALGRAEADLFARAADPVYQMAAAFQPMRSAGKPLAAIAHDRDGLRQLVRRFAWFLRRSCTDRPCAARLEVIMRLADADNCFPYTDGRFASQSCEQPQWKECLEEAELENVLQAPTLRCDE